LHNDTRTIQGEFRAIGRGLVAANLGEVPVLPDADHAQEEANGTSGECGDDGAQARFTNKYHDDRTRKGGGGVDVRFEDAGSASEEEVANGASPDGRDCAQQNSDEGMKLVEQSFFCACNGEEAQAAGVQDHDEIRGDGQDEVMKREDDGGSGECDGGVAPIAESGWWHVAN
jgi:hypothetical protein